MTIEASRLRIDLQESERWRRTLNVTVPAELILQERARAASQLAKHLKLPGFRNGRVPQAMVEKHYGPRLRQETLERVIGEAYREALRAEALRPISEGEVEQVDWQGDEDLSFSISFDVQPEVDLGRLEGFAVTRPRVAVDEADIERVLTRLREQAATWWPVETGAPQPGDQVSVTVERLDPGRETEPRAYQIVLGEGDAIPDVEKAIGSLEPGASGEFAVQFPEEDANEADGSQHLRITLVERRIRDVPEADDEFARSVGAFETLEALRQRVAEDLEREAGQQAEGVVRGQLLDRILEANPFEVPRSMIDGYVDSILGDTKDADPDRIARIKEQLAPEAEVAVKRILVLERVAQMHQLHASAAEVDARIEALAEKSGISPAEAFARMQRSGQIQALEREITEEKVFAFLAERSRIEDEP